jgi:hypothetical protein
LKKKIIVVKKRIGCGTHRHFDPKYLTSTTPEIAAFPQFLNRNAFLESLKHHKA